MGSAKGEFRVDYARSESVAIARRRMLERLHNGEYDGKYYRIVADIRQLNDGRIRFKAVAQNGKHEVGTHTFSLDGGDGSFEWHDEDPDEH